MLPRMDDYFTDIASIPDQPGEGGRFDELGSGTDNCQQLHTIETGILFLIILKIPENKT